MQLGRRNPNSDKLFIRLGLAYLSAHLKANGHDVSLIDLRTLTGWEEYEERLREEKPDWLGVSVMSIELGISREAALRAKNILPNILCVAGGSHPTSNPEDLIGQEYGFDYVIKGEGEVSFPELIKNPDQFDSVFWGKSINLDNVLIADRTIWDDFQQRTMTDPFGLPGYRFPLPFAEIINIRGCPYQCSFCFGPGEQNMYTKETTGGKRIANIRGRSVENVMQELHFLCDTYGVKSVMFHDDHFLMSKAWCLDFCQALHEHGFVDAGLKWVTSIKADAICKHEDVIHKMGEAGLEMLIIGYESFSPRVLKWFNKTATREQNLEAAKICKEAGIKVWANYILGVPTDTGWHPEDDLMTVGAVLETDPMHYSPSFLTAVPGSPLYDYYKDNDLILGDMSAESLGERGPLAAKLKGVDYDFLSSIVVTDAG